MTYNIEGANRSVETLLGEAEPSSDYVEVKFTYDVVHGKVPKFVQKVLRCKCHKRVLITVPLIAVSDDKNHDSSFVQYWRLHGLLPWIEKMGFGG